MNEKDLKESENNNEVFQLDKSSIVVPIDDSPVPDTLESDDHEDDLFSLEAIDLTALKLESIEAKLDNLYKEFQSKLNAHKKKIIDDLHGELREYKDGLVKKMERENFYILLDLSVDPPEDDLQVIAKAIKDKQAIWSRQRNHPTKGVAAKNYISMLSEIRKVMKDPALRILEADAAVQIVFDKEKEKYSEIDKHISLHMSKGYITEEEIFKLAAIHRIDVNEIRSRTKAVEDDKFEKIDKQLKIRMPKGYITEAEISQLARIYSVEEEEIRSRTTCPVRKEAFMEGDKIKPLDKSIEKIIKDNLKIVGAPSLYQFLNVSSGSSLEEIRKSIDINDGEIKKTGKKDARVTACDTLLGYCRTIFSSDESRYAYDMIFAQSCLAELNWSIDVAGSAGIIQAEYFDPLVKLAVDIGMEVAEAEQYILKYCKNKKWTIESPKKKISKKIRYAAGILLVAIIAACTIAFIDFSKKERLKNNYQLMLADFNNQKDMKQKEQILRDFIDSSRPNEFTADAKVKINEIARLVDQDEYDKLIREIDLFEKEKKYNRAIDACGQYLKKNSKTSFMSEVKQKIIFFSNLVDYFDYPKVQETSNLDIQSRLSAYTGYLKKHPDGKYIDFAKKMISAMSGEYYIFFTKEISIYEKNEDWQKGILLADKFIEIYKNNNRVPGVKKLQNRFRTFLWQKEAFDGLREKAEAKKEQFAEAKQIYYEFLYAYPDTYVNDKINKEIAKLEKLEKNAEIKATKTKIRNMIQQVGGNRYVDNNDGTVKDAKTGLIWSVLDSSIVLGDGCLDYDNAVSHVKKMKTGGYQDWRLPTREELETIYKKKPYFPQTEAPWYWTSKSYSRYSDGWSKMVDIVTSSNQAESAKQQVDARECGWVRAVRK